MFSKSAGYRQTLLDAHAHSGNTKQGQPLKNFKKRKKRNKNNLHSSIGTGSLQSVIKVFLSMKRL